MLEILTDVDADHLRCHQNREDRGGNGEGAERGGRPVAPCGCRDDRQGEEDGRDRPQATLFDDSQRLHRRLPRERAFGTPGQRERPASRPRARADGLLRLCLTTAPAGGVVGRIVKRLVALQHPQHGGREHRRGSGQRREIRAGRGREQRDA